MQMRKLQEAIQLANFDSVDRSFPKSKNKNSLNYKIDPIKEKQLKYLLSKFKKREKSHHVMI